MTRAVHQVVPALHPGDAVGNEAREFRRALRAAGFASELFAGWCDPRLAGEAQGLSAYAAQARADGVTLFHFGPGPAARAVAGAPGRLVLRYHNVTPPELLAAHAPQLARSCAEARGELAALASRVDRAFAVSEFNRRDLVALGFTTTAVVPLGLDLARLSGGDPVAERLYGDGRTNLLAVGRLAPNKRIDDVIDAFAVYQRMFDPGSRLVLAGSADGFEAYVGTLLRRVAALRAERVVLAGRVEDAELATLYGTAHALVSLSEHEGFCAPLVEAMSRDVPVVAYAAGAVEETLGGAGVLLRDKRADLVAGVLDALRRDPRLRASVIEAQRRRLGELTARDPAECLLSELELLSGTATSGGVA